eukprot:c14769_g1_i1.p1 GENE.c14769_g1_i1~~c14769_g1_i1.p1  ORF type:complete len:275 (-),score=26.25 c14769_g1_i1:42-821(-)
MNQPRPFFKVKDEEVQDEEKKQTRLSKTFKVLLSVLVISLLASGIIAITFFPNEQNEKSIQNEKSNEVSSNDSVLRAIATLSQLHLSDHTLANEKAAFTTAISKGRCAGFGTCWECNSIAFVMNCAWNAASAQCESAAINYNNIPSMSQCQDTPPTVVRFEQGKQACYSSGNECNILKCLLRLETSPELSGKPCMANLLSEIPLNCNGINADSTRKACALVPGCDCAMFHTCVNAANCSRQCRTMDEIMSCPRSCGLCS